MDLKARAFLRPGPQMEEHIFHAMTVASRDFYANHPNQEKAPSRLNVVE